MNRRIKTILLPLAAAVLAAGCSTFDTDTVASVNGEDLSRDQLNELINVIPGAASQQGQLPIPGDPDNLGDIRQSIAIWVQSQVQADRIAERGLEIPAAALDEAITGLSGPTGLPGFTELSDETRDLLAGFVAGQQVSSQPATTASDELLDYYDRGPEASGIICTSHILVSDEASAVDITNRLDAGEDFAVIAAAESIDPGSGTVGGSLGCTTLTSFATQFVPEFVAGGLTATVGEPTDPVESEFGFHIILVRTAADSAQDLAPFESDPTTALRRADVDIASRYGTFDANIGQVVPLG